LLPLGASWLEGISDHLTSDELDFSAGPIKCTEHHAGRVTLAAQRQLVPGSSEQQHRELTPACHFLGRKSFT